MEVGEIRDVLAHTNAVASTRRLTEFLTGLEPKLLDPSEASS